MKKIFLSLLLYGLCLGAHLKASPFEDLEKEPGFKPLSTNAIQSLAQIAENEQKRLREKALGLFNQPPTNQKANEEAFVTDVQACIAGLQRAARVVFGLTQDGDDWRILWRAHTDKATTNETWKSYFNTLEAFAPGLLGRYIWLQKDKLPDNFLIPQTIIRKEGDAFKVDEEVTKTLRESLFTPEERSCLQTIENVYERLSKWKDKDFADLHPDAIQKHRDAPAHPQQTQEQGDDYDLIRMLGMGVLWAGSALAGILSDN